MIVEADDRAIAEAARILRAGGLVAFPTETVYGLGADATNGKAVARIFEAKGRPRFNPLIAHVDSLGAARDLVEFTDEAAALAETFWPGPLTLVLPQRPGARHRVSELVTAGLDTLAVRVPAHPVARQLIAAAGVPIAAPSANLSGRVSPTCARHVEEDLGRAVDTILDGGATQAGLESTIVAFAPAPTLLRPGGLAREDIEAVLGRRCRTTRNGRAFPRPAREPLCAAQPSPARRHGLRGRRIAARFRPWRSRRRAEPEPKRRLARGGGQPVRLPESPGRPRPGANRRHAHPALGAWRGHQRSPPPRKRPPVRAQVMLNLLQSIGM